TYNNGDVGWNDPVADENDHTAVYFNGDSRHVANANRVLGAVNIGNIEDGQWREMRIVWDPVSQNLSYYLGGALMFSGTVNLVARLGTNQVYWGYTASTGGLSNLHQICNINLPPSPVSMRVTKASNGPWTQGQVGAAYTLGVSTQVGTSVASTASIPTVVRDVLPTGITPNWAGTLSTNGWSCTFSGQNVTCTQSISLAANAAVTSNIVLPVNVTAAAAAASPVTNYASVGGGGDSFNGGAAPTPGAACTDPNRCASVQTVTRTPVTHNCPIGSTVTGSGLATSGTGLYRDRLFWLDWNCGASTEFAAGDTVNKSWVTPNGAMITATISNIEDGSIAPYNTGDWAGDQLDNLYGGVNPIGLRNVLAGTEPTFDITWAASINGVSVPVDLVMADAEDLATSNELVRATTNGNSWQLLESGGSITAQFTDAGQTLTLQDVANAGSGTALALSENTTLTNVTVDGGGISAIAFAVAFGFDYADAPAPYGITGNYQELAAAGGGQPGAPTNANSIAKAALTFSTPTWLGTVAPDVERNDQHSAAATGDDTNGVDDEDGVNPATLTLTAANTSFSTTVVASNSTGTAAKLIGWIDWNNNGVFEASEAAQVAVPASASNQTFTLSWSGLTGLSAGNRFARFRVSTDPALTPTAATAALANGEVEDYVVVISPPATTTAVINPVTAPAQCSSTSVHQLDAFNHVTATGAGTGGIPSLSYTVPAGNSRLVFVVATFERDHSPIADGTGDNYASNNVLTGVVADIPNLFLGGVPMIKASFANANVGVTTTKPDGQMSFERYVYVLPEASIPAGANTLAFASNLNTPKSAGDEATLIIGTFGNVFTRQFGGSIFGLNASLNLDPTAPVQPLGTTTADNMLVAVSTLGGSYSMSSTAGWTRAAELIVNNTAGGYALDPNRIPTVYTENDGLSELVMLRSGVSTTQTLNVSSPNSSVYNMNLQAFRLVAAGCDHGDAPASYGAPTHTQSLNVFMGATYGDADAGAQPSANADGDDLDGIDDEDGVVIAALTQGQTATLDVSVNGAGGYLQGWIDWNNNGVFDAAEQIITNLQDNAVGDTNPAAGTIAVSITVPNNAVANTPTYARFRWSTQVSLTATGLSNNGEIEDYSVTIAENTVQITGRAFNDNSGTTALAVNAYNGVQDTGEVGIIGSVVELTDCLGGVIASTETDALGDYQFSVNATSVSSPNFCISQTNLPTYVSVSGTTGYDRSTDTITVSNTGASAYTDHNFGDARLNLILTTDGQQTTTAGGTVSYPHTLRT
ncbi:MAG: CshA/CshB family fibrillar adhesin-related protein, partial [Pseudomonadota bacterium]|nr:CshA/CshB family fibrillar adhesin-related protein [Pseudomonadota bacterium]